MRRSAITLLILLLLLPAGPALADPPVRGVPPVRVEDSFVVSNCGFEVQIDVTGKTGEIVFGDSIRLIAPGEKVTLTNLDNRNTTTVNVAGPGRLTLIDDLDGGFTSTLIGTGNWLVFNVEDPSDPIKLVTGRFTITATFDADGTLATADEDFGTARVVNLCTVLM